MEPIPDFYDYNYSVFGGVRPSPRNSGWRFQRIGENTFCSRESLDSSRKCRGHDHQRTPGLWNQIPRDREINFPFSGIDLRLPAIQSNRLPVSHYQADWCALSPHSVPLLTTATGGNANSALVPGLPQFEAGAVTADACRAEVATTHPR